MEIPEKSEEFEQASSDRTKLFLRPKFWIIGAGVIALVVVVLFLSQTQGGIKLITISSDESHSVEKPLTMSFSRVVSSVEPEITPAVEGEWRVTRNFLGVNGIEFIPSRAFLADTIYTVKFSRVDRVLFGGGEIDNFTFRTEKAPAIQSTSLDSLGDKTNIIAMDQPLSVTLTSKARNLRELQLKINPAVELTRRSSDGQTFSWSYDGLLDSNKDYTIVVSDKVQREELKRFRVKTASQPTLDRPVKEHYVTPSDEIKIIFKESISDKDRPDVSFSLAGNGQWLSAKEYKFTPSERLQPGRSYSYVLPKGLRTEKGGILAKEVKKSFSTNGVVKVVGLSPQGYGLTQSGQQVRVTFDQSVNRKSAENRLRVSTGKIKGVSWQGNTLVAQVANLGFQKTVWVSIDPGVQPIFGLPSNHRVSYSFTTEARTVKLPVPFYNQVYAQSCEAANLRMALAYRGVRDSDWNILQKFGYDPRPRDKKKNIWDNPNEQFVGNVKGDQGAGTGWGVYAGPVSRAAASYGRSTSVAYGANIGFVARQIHAGNPVIAWGVWGGSARIESWKTPSGATVRGPIPMHVRLVVGVVGEPHSPIGFYVHDPITGPAYWTADQLAGNIAAAGPAAQLLAIH